MGIGCEKKQEETIRGMAEQCIKAQMEILESLESNFFNRRPLEGKSSPGIPPIIPNVLDEIIEELKRVLALQKQTIEFINYEINPKL